MSENTEAMRPKPGHFSWNELMAADTGTAATFYEGLFGWQTEPFNPEGESKGPPYTLFKLSPDGMGVGGMIAAPDGGPARWVPYVVVENIDASLAKVAGLGGTVIVPLMDVGMVGKIAVILDPGGAVLGLHELAPAS